MITKEKILDILEKHYHGRNHIESRCADELLGLIADDISNVIKRLDTDDSEITFGDYFLEVGEYNFIHILIEDDGDYEDYTLPNGIEVVPLTKSDFDWNSKITEYRRIVNVFITLDSPTYGTKYKIRKGDKFLCLKDYVMYNDSIAYIKGRTYLADQDDCIQDEIDETNHVMTNQEDFFEYFKPLQ